MVAYTTSLRLIKQDYASNAESWGGELNAGVFDMVDAAFQPISVTVDADVTLTVENAISDQSRPLHLTFTGAGGFTVTAPAVAKVYFVRNNCTDDVTLTPDGGTGATIRAGTGVWFWTDGSTSSVNDLTLDKIKTAAANVGMGGFKLTNVGVATATTDAATLANKIHEFAAPTAALAMNSQKITGLADGTNAQDAATKAQVDAVTSAVQADADAAAASASAAATSATNAAASETATAALYTDFQERYLGAKASDPTVDNEGNALQTGALYFNTTANEMRAYNGSTWAVLDVPTIASQAEAEAGTNNTNMMTPLRTAQSLAALSALVPLGNLVEASSDAAIDILLTSGYEEYVIRFWNVLPDTDAQSLAVRTSADGSTFDSGASDYRYATLAMRDSSTSPAASVSVGSTQMIICVAVGNDTDETGVSGSLRIFRPDEVSPCEMFFDGTHVDSNGSFRSFWGGGRRTSAAAVTAVRFLFAATPTIRSGYFQLYGVKAFP